MDGGAATLHKRQQLNYSGDGPYIDVPIGAIRLGYTGDFDIYLPQSTRAVPVLYVRAGQPFTEAVRQRLREHGVERLCIHEKQHAAFTAYRQAHLGAILADESLPLEDRCLTLYHASQDVMQEVMHAPRSGGMVQRGTELVGHTIALMRNNRGVLHNLMRVTSFDYYTYTHSVNVFVFGVALARRLAFDETQIERFGLGLLMHDVGKSELPASLINKRGKLTEAEWEKMKRHPATGEQILKEQGVTDTMMLEVVRHHHEKLDGSGYPDGLAGDEIGPWVRVSTIADVFDALTTQRSYKDALNSFPSLKLMQDEMHDMLDREYFRAFVQLVGDKNA